MTLPACINSNASLMRSSGNAAVIISSILISPAI